MESNYGNIPTVVLTQIYESLSSTDRLQAASTCRNWRFPVFQLPLSKHLNLMLKCDMDHNKVRFLSEQFGRKVQSLKLILNPNSRVCLDLVQEIMANIEENMQLKSLKIRFTEDSLSKDVFQGTGFTNLIHRIHVVRCVINPLVRIVKRRNCLETLSFPIVHELAIYMDQIFSALANYKCYNSKNLFLATLRTTLGENNIQPNFLMLRNVDRFINLQMLSIDHDALTDNILCTLGVGNKLGGLKQLNLVAIKSNDFVSVQGWDMFVSNNPLCKVRLTLVGSNIVFDHQSNLLFHSIPITHFRALYCRGIRMSCLNSLIRWNEDTLEYIELVHENHDWMDYIVGPEPIEETEFLDPIIYAAWRCVNLQTIKISFLYYGESLIGIARLRGPNLLQLEIPKSQIVYRNMAQLSQEISKALGRPWSPSDDFGGLRRMPRSERLQTKLVRTLRSIVADESSTLSTSD